MRVRSSQRSEPSEQCRLSKLLFKIAHQIHRRIPIGRLQFNAHALAAKFDCLVHGRADATKRVEHKLALIAPQADAPFDEIQLQRADVAFIGILTAKTLIQRVGLSNDPSDPLRPINPFHAGNIVLYRHLI